MNFFYLVLTVLLTFNGNLNAQFVDDMEYPNGPPYGEWWVPAPIIGNGVGTIPGDGTTEAILDLGNKTVGEWGLKFWMYVPSNKEAYWNIQGEIPIGAGEFIVGNIFFNQDLASPGLGHIDDTALGDVYFHFPHDEWFEVVMNFDMNLGISEATWNLIIAGSYVLWEGTAFTNEAGEVPTSLGGIDFFSISTNTEYYIDTFKYVNDFIDGVYMPAPFTDDMESYTEGESIYGDWWTSLGCGEELGCALESTSAKAHSGNLSGLVPGDGTSSPILNLGNKIFGVWGLEFWMYIPSGKEAYWNLQGEVAVGGSEERIVGNIFFNQDLASPGIGLIDDTALGEVNFNFPHDQWFRVVMNWDISLGVALATWQFNVDGIDVIPFGTPFTKYDGTIPSSLGGIDFFSVSADNELYVDDFNYLNEFIDTEPNPNPVTDDMESYTEGGPIFEGWWGSWGCGEDLGCALESTSAQAYSGTLSGLVPGDGTSSPDLNLGNKTSGEWALEFYLYIPENKEGYYNLQGSIPIGAGEWIVGNIFFNHDLTTPGIGNIDNSALGNVEFNFPHGEWFSIIMNVDLTDGMSQGTWQYIVDGVEVIPEGTPFTDYSGEVPTSLGGLNFFSTSINHELYIDDLNYIEGVILGTNDVNDLRFSIYPNPAINNINISTTESIERINIYSMQGILLIETNSKESIDVSSLSSGIYFIEVLYEKWKRVQKLIKN